MQVLLDASEADTWRAREDGAGAANDLLASLSAATTETAGCRAIMEKLMVWSIRLSGSRVFSVHGFWVWVHGWGS
jgi:hypothetical protein